jgi:serine/threonine-protein kinase
MAPRLTTQGEFLGSPAYSAPELLKGADPTPSSDRYAFGVTAFELMTGQLPHPGPNVAAVITHVLHEPIVTPPGMSGDLANVFRKALAFDADERHETLMEFLTALIDAYPLEDSSRDRVEELFRHDDHAGDIVPMRRNRPRAISAGIDSGSGTAVPRSTGRTSTGRPALSPTGSAIRIELEPEQTNPGFRPPPIPRGPQPPPSRTEDGVISPKTLIKWILIVLVFGQLAWWVYGYLQPYMSGAPQP